MRIVDDRHDDQDQRQHHDQDRGDNALEVVEHRGTDEVAGVGLIAAGQRFRVPQLEKDLARGRVGVPRRPGVDRVGDRAAKLVGDVGADTQVWERVLVKLSLRAMPPVGMPLRPDEDEYEALTGYLQAELDRTRATASLRVAEAGLTRAAGRQP